jgi:AcrR family transcriptional regulator
MFEVPRLKIRPGTGAYEKGRARVVEILEAALDILLDKGYRAISIRRIAEACDITVGNVTYYYPTKDALVKDLLDSVLESYMDVFNHIQTAPLTAEEKFIEVVRLILQDIQTKKTTHLFPELWALSNHDPFVAERVDELYFKVRIILNELIPILNPRLNKEERETVALFVSAALEGTTMFAGYKKPWGPRMPMIEGIAVKALLECVKTITPEEIHRFQEAVTTDPRENANGRP